MEECHFGYVTGTVTRGICVAGCSVLTPQTDVLIGMQGHLAP